MAASQPDSSWYDGITLSDVGHALLDIAGLVPIIGEPADLANAVWLAAEGDYLGAGLSVISMVPVVGDAIGKGGKLLKSGAGKLAGPALDALKKMDFEKVLGGLRNHPKLGPHIDKMIAALEKWRADIVGSTPPCTPTGVTICPNTGKPIGQPSPSSIRAGIPDAKIQSVLATPKGSRPDPLTYIPAKQYEKHLAKFDDGGSRIMLKKNLDKYGPGREDGTAFLMTKAEADKILHEAGGDNRKLEKLLGLPEGQLDGDSLVRVDFPHPREAGLRIPSGNEAGANEFWIPGGTLPDGTLEAVIDVGDLKPGQMIINAIGP